MRKDIDIELVRDQKDSANLSVQDLLLGRTIRVSPKRLPVS